jgi:hypothetical protein
VTLNLIQVNQLHILHPTCFRVHFIIALPSMTAPTAELLYAYIYVSSPPSPSFSQNEHADPQAPWLPHTAIRETPSILSVDFRIDTDM